jgi:hypothetical protein
MMNLKCTIKKLFHKNETKHLENTFEPWRVCSQEEALSKRSNSQFRYPGFLTLLDSWANLDENRHDEGLATEYRTIALWMICPKQYVTIFKRLGCKIEFLDENVWKQLTDDFDILNDYQYRIDIMTLGPDLWSKFLI